MTYALAVAGIWASFGLASWIMVLRGWLRVRRFNREDLAMLPLALLLGPFALYIALKS
jgi:hypothetical protein